MPPGRWYTTKGSMVYWVPSVRVTVPGKDRYSPLSTSFQMKTLVLRLFITLALMP